MQNDLLNGRPVEMKRKERSYEELEFPKGMHHPVYGCRVIHNEEQEDALLEAGWYNNPADFPPAVEEEEKEIDAAEMKAKFDAAWSELTAKHNDLLAAHATLEEQNRRLMADNNHLVNAAADLRAAKPQAKAKAAKADK